MHKLPANTGFIDVQKGSPVSATNMNKVHAAVRELQQTRPPADEIAIELARVDLSDVDASRPDFNDGTIGTVDVLKAVGTKQSLEIEELSSTVFQRRVKELSVEMKRDIWDVGQKFFSRDEVMLIISMQGSYIPIKLGGAEKIIAMLVSDLGPATYATDEITPTFGTGFVYDWNSTGTKLVKTNKSVRLANITDSTVKSGTPLNAFAYGKNYVIDFEVCS